MASLTRKEALTCAVASLWWRLVLVLLVGGGGIGDDDGPTYGPSDRQPANTSSGTSMRFYDSSCWHQQRIMVVKRLECCDV